MSTLYVDNLQPNLGSRVMAAGHVVQVVEGTNNTYQTFSGASGALSLSATITPTSATSKILVMVHLDGCTTTSDNAGYGYFRVYRNNTTILRPFGYPKGWSSVDNSSGTTVYTQLLDSPATTSATTYNIWWINQNGSTVQEVNRDAGGFVMSSIILQEIAQ